MKNDIYFLEYQFVTEFISDRFYLTISALITIKKSYMSSSSSIINRISNSYWFRTFVL